MFVLTDLLLPLLLLLLLLSSSPSQQNQVIRRRNARLARLLFRLPPPAADVGDLENLVLGETDFVSVVRVGFIRVDGFGPVGVFGWRGHVGVRIVMVVVEMWVRVLAAHAAATTQATGRRRWRLRRRRRRGQRSAEPRLRGIAAIVAHEAAWVARHGR